MCGTTDVKIEQISVNHYNNFHYNEYTSAELVHIITILSQLLG